MHNSVITKVTSRDLKWYLEVWGTNGSPIPVIGDKIYLKGALYEVVERTFEYIPGSGYECRLIIDQKWELND